MKHWCLQAYIKIYQGEDLPQPKTMLMVCAELWKIKLFFVKCFILYFFSPGYSRGQQPSSCSRSQRPVLQEHGESEFALSSKICVQALFCYFPLEKCSKLHWIEPLTEDPPPFCAAVSFNPRHEREIRTKNIYTWCKVVFFYLCENMFYQMCLSSRLNFVTLRCVEETYHTWLLTHWRKSTVSTSMRLFMHSSPLRRWGDRSSVIVTRSSCRRSWRKCGSRSANTMRWKSFLKVLAY